MGAAEQKEKQSEPQALGFESDVRTEPAPAECANQSAAAARGLERWDPPRPAPLFVVSTTAGAGSQHSPGGGQRRGPRPRRRRARAQDAALPRPPSHVGEHGRAAAPGHDQPVRAGRGLRGRPGKAAATGGPLAVRDRPEHVFPRNQHSQQPPPPPDDVHPQQHTCHTAQLPRRPGHVLQASCLRGPAEQQ